MENGKATARPQSDGAYEKMFRVGADRLRAHTPEEIARKAGVRYDAGRSALIISSMGVEYALAWPSCRLQPEPENWHTLVLLHYLDLADGTPVLTDEIALSAGETAAPANGTVPLADGSAGQNGIRLITFQQVPNGLVRGGKFEFTAARNFERILRGKTPEQIRNAVRSLGAAECSGKGDLCFRIPFFPHFPVFLNIWFADEDFPASGHFYLDRSAGHYLTIEDVVTVGEILLRRLEDLL